MLFSAVLAAGAIQSLAAPESFAANIFFAGNIPLAADFDGDGFGDIAVVRPGGNAYIDLYPLMEGVKITNGYTPLRTWGRDCQAAALGEFDPNKGPDIAGIFGGKTIKLAHDFSARHFKSSGDWVVLPTVLAEPQLATLSNGQKLAAFSAKTGDGYLIDIKTKKAKPFKLPAGIVKLGDMGGTLAGQTRKGEMVLIDPVTFKKFGTLGTTPAGQDTAVADGMAVYGSTLWTASGKIALKPTGLPTAPNRRIFCDMDGDGDQDLVEFRLGTEAHTAYLNYIYRAVRTGETDSDHDGLTNAEEAEIGSDPYKSDTDNDGMIDGWEVNGYRGIDFKKLGCSPIHMDAVCLMSRFPGVTKDKMNAEMDRATQFYADLKFRNLDGKSGLNLHLIYTDEVKEEHTSNSWQTNRGIYRPAKWQGVLHWMQATPGGGGQADQLGDGGTVGANSLWAVFVHEFGHQMGLDHNGYWSSSFCPLYPSLLNYAYSYSLEDDWRKIRYSTGELSSLVLNERDLDETLPFPISKVSFLAKGPYYYRLKEAGNNTLIDWNWNGVFGEKHVKADINYGYSTHAGSREDTGKIQTAPSIFIHKKLACFAYGRVDKGEGKTLSAANPGTLYFKSMAKRKTWDKEAEIDKDLIGDPFGISYGTGTLVFYQTKTGVKMAKVNPAPTGATVSEKRTISADSTLIPTAGVMDGSLILFHYNPATLKVTYQVAGPDLKFGPEAELDTPSRSAAGFCVDTIAKEVALGLLVDQDKKLSRWQIRKYGFKEGKLTFKSLEWVEGEKGNAAGSFRPTLLFDATKDAGPKGRFYFYCRGGKPEDGNVCIYLGRQVADKSFGGGWIVKRYYDEWTTSRSAPSAAWWNGDILYAYRWASGGNDNMMHVGYTGLGLEKAPMGDFDDIGYIRNFGMKFSLMVLGNP